MARKQYRIQRSEHQGILQRGWGYGRVTSWSSWRTVAQFDTQEAAEAIYDAHAGRGLTRWQLIYGTKVLRRSE